MIKRKQQAHLNTNISVGDLVCVELYVIDKQIAKQSKNMYVANGIDNIFEYIRSTDEDIKHSLTCVRFIDFSKMNEVEIKNKFGGISKFISVYFSEVKYDLFVHQNDKLYSQPGLLLNIDLDDDNNQYCRILFDESPPLWYEADKTIKFDE